MFSTYDQWKTTDPNEDRYEPEPGCSVCAGGREPPCCEDCERIASRAQARRNAARLANACRLALALARRYRAEGDGLASPRLLATLARFGELRDALRKESARARGGGE